jgi:hypothetical protein
MAFTPTVVCHHGGQGMTTLLDPSQTHQQSRRRIKLDMNLAKLKKSAFTRQST